MLPIMLVAMTRDANSLRWTARLKHLSIGLLIFLLTLILLTPGMMLEARQFVQDVYSEIIHEGIPPIAYVLVSSMPGLIYAICLSVCHRTTTFNS